MAAKKGKNKEKNNVNKIESKIEDFDKYENEVVYQNFNDKTDILPHIILVFDSKRRVLKMPGFPSLFKEIAEIIECGDL